MGPIWGRQDPGGAHVGHMNFAIWDSHTIHSSDAVPVYIEDTDLVIKISWNIMARWELRLSMLNQEAASV